MNPLPPWLAALVGRTMEVADAVRRPHRCGPNIGRVYTLSSGASEATPRPLFSRCEVCGREHYMGRYIGTLPEVGR